MKRPSPTQLAVLQRMKASGHLVRWPGGFWTVEGMHASHLRGKRRVPFWYTAAGTVSALERNGLIERCHPKQDDCDRRITEKGLAVVRAEPPADHDQLAHECRVCGAHVGEQCQADGSVRWPHETRGSATLPMDLQGESR